MPSTKNLPLLATPSEYAVWSVRATAWFEVNDLYPYVDGSASRNDPEEWAAQNRKAKAYIIMMMGPEMLQYAQRAQTAAEAWGKIKARCEPEGALVSAVLKRNLETMRLNQGDDIPSLISKYDDLIARLAKVGSTYNEDTLGTMLLSALDLDDPRFASLFHSATLNEQGTIRYSKVSAYLLRLAGIRSLKEEGELTAEANLARAKTSVKAVVKPTAKARPPKGRCSNCNIRGHTFEQCYRPGGGSEGQGPKQLKAKAQENKGGRTGDRDRGSERERARAKVEEIQANLAQAMAQLELVEASSDDETVSEFSEYPEACATSVREGSTREQEWTADSASTHHLSRSKPKRSTRLHPPHRIGLAGQGQSMPAVATGVARIGSRKKHIRLTSVYHVPDASHDLLSIPKLADDGYTVIMRNDGGKITDTMTDEQYEAIDGVSLRRQGPYWKIGGERDAHAFATSAAASTLLDLHLALGHAGRSRLVELVQKDLVAGLPGAVVLDEEIACDACATAKSTRQPFRSATKARRSDTPLELVHMDLAGPFQASIGDRYRYYLVIVDDATRFVWVTFLRAKHEAPAAIRRFRAYAEKRYERTIKTIRTDRGGEFTDGALEAYLREAGIRHQTSEAGTPQQNGVAERMNRTLKEGAAAIQIGGRLPESCWPYSIKAMARASNRLPTKALKESTPYEALTGEKANVSDERPLGTTCFVHIPSSKRYKTISTPKATKGVYLGVAANSKGYKVLLPNKAGLPKVVDSRDVSFRNTVEPLAPQNDRNSPRAQPTTVSVEVLDPQVNQPHEDPEEQEHESASSGSADEAEEAEEETEEEDDPPRRSTRARKAVTFAGGTRPGTEAAEEQAPRRSARLAQPPPSPTTDSSAEEDEDEEEDAPRRSSRICKPIIFADGTKATLPQARDDALLAQAMLARALKDDIPRNHREAMASSKGDIWREAEQVEMAAFFEAKVGKKVVRPPSNVHVIDSRMVYDDKRDDNGSVIKHKARWVARGFQQIEGVDFELTFSPTGHLTALRLVVAIAAEENMELDQFDFERAFFNGDLDVPIYMELPEGHGRGGDSVVLLKKALYGLKQAGRCWWKKLDQYLVSELGFERLNTDWGVYSKKEGTDRVVIFVHVDDLLVAHKGNLWRRLLKKLVAAFKITGGQPVSTFLGIKFTRDRRASTITLNMPGYFAALLEKHGMTHCNSADTPMVENLKLEKEGAPLVAKRGETVKTYQARVGALMWASTTVRPDLSVVAGILGQFSSDPRKEHWDASTRALKYIKKTLTGGVRFGGRTQEAFGHEPGELVGFSDADWAGDVTDRRSRTGYLFMKNGPVSWASQKQVTQALSSTEAEYMAITESGKEAIHLRMLLQELDPVPSPRPATTLYVDNEGARRLTQNPSFHRRAKHIELRWHWIRGRVDDETIGVYRLETKRMPADAMTKPLGRVLLERHLRAMGMVFPHPVGVLE
ncbi:hypothetical protein JCM1840_000519 [Sporobolomyces johnsonii]